MIDNNNDKWSSICGSVFWICLFTYLAIKHLN